MVRCSLPGTQWLCPMPHDITWYMLLWESWPYWLVYNYIWYNMQFICANVSSWMRLPFHKDLPMARLSELFNAPWQKILGFLDPNLQFFDIFRMYCTAIFRMFVEVVGAPLVNSTQLKRFARWTTSSFRKSTLRPCSSQGAVSRPQALCVLDHTSSVQIYASMQ